METLGLQADNKAKHMAAAEICAELLEHTVLSWPHCDIARAAEKEGLGCSTGELCFIEIERGGKVLSFAKEDMKWGGTHRVHLATAFLHT